MLWAAMSLLLAATLALLAAPLLRQKVAQGNAAEADLAHYRNELRELDKALEAGTVSAAEAADTRAEIERRVLAVARDREGQPMENGAQSGRGWGLALTLGWIVVGSTAIYAIVGRPDLPSPQAAAPSVPDIRTLAQQAPAAAPAVQTGEAPALADVDTMIDQLAARLEAEPDDLQGWRMLGWSWFRTGNFEGAAEAYRRASELAPENDEILSLHAEAMIRARGGRVDAAAQSVIDRVLRLNPTNPRAGFFAGMALDQAGDPQAAIARWLEVYDASPPDAEWLPDLVARIRERAAEVGYDLADRPGLGMAPAPAPSTLRAPTQEEVAAAQAMDQGDRNAMIEGMVAGLAARLEDSPDDIDGWLRLIRSYAVLGDLDAARQARGKAADVFADRPGRLVRIDGLAAELGLD